MTKTEQASLAELGTDEDQLAEKTRRMDALAGGRPMTMQEIVDAEKPVRRKRSDAGRPRVPIAHDPVHHPAHYTFGSIEVIEVIEDWQLGFHLGNAIKYIARAGKKGDALEDLEKAKWYLEREMKKLRAR